MSQRKRHYNETPVTMDLAARMFEAAGIGYSYRDHYALASDLTDVLTDIADAGQEAAIRTFLDNIGGLGNLRNYVDTIRHNYFES